MLERIRYFIFRALRNMRQWPFLCTASILTMAVALATVGSFFLVVVNVEQLATRWTKEIQVIAYLKAPPATAELPELIKKIKNFPEVTTVAYVSPAEAMTRFRERLGDESGLLDGISDNVLPASFEIGLQPEYRTQQESVSLLKNSRIP